MATPRPWTVLCPWLYGRLRQLARRRLPWTGCGWIEDLDTTALVHEAYLKLVNARQARFRVSGRTSWPSRPA